jgi:hypothetical protein
VSLHGRETFIGRCQPPLEHSATEQTQRRKAPSAAIVRCSGVYSRTLAQARIEPMRHAADGEAMADYGGIVIITREPDLADAPFYREQHSVVGRFVGHREGDDGSFLEASPVEMWDDVDEAIAWGRGRAPVVVVRLGEHDRHDLLSG